MLDDILLREFAHGFYGYGSLTAPWWFVGMEEGGGTDEVQIAARLSAWARRGKIEIDDIAEFHREIGVSKFWLDNPSTQPTWRKLIRLRLAATLKHENVTQSQIREYQRDRWGRKGGESSLFELLPLPSPDSNSWLYCSWTRIPQLESRKSYLDWMLPFRIEAIRKKLAKHCPKVVVFYGSSYRQHWEAIADVEFAEAANGDFFSGNSGETQFLITHHPVSKWSNKYWDQVGRAILLSS